MSRPRRKSPDLLAVTFHLSIRTIRRAALAFRATVTSLARSCDFEFYSLDQALATGNQWSLTSSDNFLERRTAGRKIDSGHPGLETVRRAGHPATGADEDRDDRCFESGWLTRPSQRRCLWHDHRASGSGPQRLRRGHHHGPSVRAAGDKLLDHPGPGVGDHRSAESAGRA